MQSHFNLKNSCYKEDFQLEYICFYLLLFVETDIENELRCFEILRNDISLFSGSCLSLTQNKYEYGVER